MFNQLVESLLHAVTEEYKLDKSCSFKVDDVEGKNNLNKRLMLVSLYLTVIYVRTAGIRRLQQRNAMDMSMKVLMVGQIMTSLNNIVVSDDDDE